jgi:hypothetical protein
MFIFKVPIDTSSTSTTIDGTYYLLVILPTLQPPIPHNPIIWIFLSFSLWSLVQRYWTYWTAVEEALCVGVQWPANLQVANPSQSPTLGPNPNVGL